MMKSTSEIVVPLATNVGEENPTRKTEGLVGRLDDLLEKYLQSLDEYQKARNELSACFSSVCHFARSVMVFD